jgi:thiamine biosynthesis lipoprotein
MLSFAIVKAQHLQRFEFSHRQMGTQFNIVLYAADKLQAAAAANKAFERIDSLNQIFSDYIPNSELRKLSKQPINQWLDISSDLWKVLHFAQRISKKSKGAFDITIGPLSVLWRRAFRRQEFPNLKEIQAAKVKVNYKALRLKKNKRLVKLKADGLRLDAGGIAKGYAVDEAYAVLKAQGFSIALVDGGGDIYAGDAPPEKEGWTIRIQDLKVGAIRDTILTIQNQAIATSGDKYKFLEWEGKRYAHIINPLTGMGITSRAQVTVLAPTCIQADALASTLTVLPPEKGLKLIRKFRDTSARILLLKEKQTFRYGF